MGGKMVPGTLQTVASVLCSVAERQQPPKSHRQKDMIMSNTDPNRGRPDEVRPVQVKQVGGSNTGMIAAIVILVVAVIGGFIWYNSSYRTETAPVVQNNTTTTAPAPAQPAPETPAQPPAVEPPAPASPPAPATNP